MVVPKKTVPVAVGGWGLALEKAPMFLTLLLFMFLPFLTQLYGANPLLIKTSLVWVIAALLPLFWALKVAYDGRLVLIRVPAQIPLALLFLWIMGTGFLSPYFRASFQALFSFMPLLVLCLLFTQLFREIWQAENLLIVFLTASMGTALWAIGQGMGWVPGPWTEIVDAQFSGRVVGGLGNPNFLAGYLLVAWPLAFGLLLRAQSRFAQAYWFLVFASCLFALHLTGSKAGWLGLMAGFFTYLVFFFWNSLAQTWTAKGILVAAALGLAALTLSPSMWTRLREAVNPVQESTLFRKQVWSGTWEMIKEKPLVGHGFGTFKAAFPSHRPQGLMLRQKERSYEVDHAHNWVLEWTAETGVVGLGLLLFFWGSVIYPWWKLYRANAVTRSLTAAGFAVFAGVAVNNLFDVNHSLPSTLVPLFLVAALPVALSQRFHHLPEFCVRRKEVDFSRLKPVLWVAALGMLLGTVNWIRHAMELQKADIHLKRANVLAGSGDFKQAAVLYRQAIPRDAFWEGFALEPKYFLASCYLDQGANDPAEALRLLDEVGAVEPDFVLIHLKRSQALGRLGRGKEARIEMMKAVRLDPALVLGLPEFQRARKLARAGKLHEALDLYEVLESEISKAVPESPMDSIPVVLDSANVYALFPDWEMASILYALVLRMDPYNVDALYNLGYVALELGETVAAREALHTLEQLLPGDPRVQQLKEKIVSGKL